MQPDTTIRYDRRFWWTVLASLCAGCGHKGGTFDNYAPKAQAARAALAAALTAWQNGAEPGRIEAASPAVQAVDFQWQAGQKLQSYEILEELQGDGPKRFSVKLTLDGSGAAQEVRYVVLGREPLWVYREEDYAKVSAM